MFRKLINPIDNILNLITMYRLVLYYLISLWICAFIFSFFNFLPFTPLQFLISTIIIVFTCWISNKIFAKLFNAITNLESVYISALILILIITREANFGNYIFFVIASILTVATKFVIALHKKHVFNPAALAVFITSLLSVGAASWWIGTMVMLPWVFLGGILIVRKIQRFNLVLSFLIAACSVISIFSFINGFSILTTLEKTIMDSPLIFFSLVMLTEPLTTPPVNDLRIIYGVLVGILFSPQLKFAGFYTTPESALLIGNIFAYFVSPKEKLMLILKEKIKISDDIYDFVFTTVNKLNFISGQYLEWTLSIKNPDSRGNRRYFTIASSPTEPEIRIGVKFYENSSSFKKSLLNLNKGDKVLAGGLSGDFTIAKNINKKFVFIAGGIGVTPYRSIIKHLIDDKQKSDIVMFYSNKQKSEIVYTDIFNNAYKDLGIKTIYNLTDLANIPKDWKGERGRLNKEMIEKYVPDYKVRDFYLSGPHAMVQGFEEVLEMMGINKAKIKKDFFPGFV